MRHSLYTFLFFFITFQPFYSQNTQQEFWDLLLNNNRKEAQKVIASSDLSSIENLVANEIARFENGQLNNNDKFLSEFLKHDDFENYLYALWNESYVFDTYLTSGFTNSIREVIDGVSKTQIKSSSIKDALFYLNAIRNRDDGKWDAYYKYNDSINVIKDWQYCGVFENLNESGIDKVYGPEEVSKSDKPFNAASNGQINWYDSKNKKDAYQFFTNHDEYGSGVTYAQSFISSPTNQRVLIRIGSGSAFKLYLNDVEIYENYEDVVTELNAYEVEVNLSAGVNRLLIKCAENNSGSYFILSILDTNRNSLNNIQATSVVSKYNTSNLETLNPVKVANEFDTFFINKINSNPDNFIYAYCLVNSYMRNKNYEDAKKVLLPYYEKYPKSSLLRSLLIKVYDAEKDYTSVNEVTDNIELEDPDYYLAIIGKFSDSKEMNRMSMTELKEFTEKFKSTFDYEFLKHSADFIYNARDENIAKLRENLDEMMKTTDGNSDLVLRMAPIYDNVFKETEKTITILEDLNANYFNLSAVRQLANYYNKKNLKDKVIELYKRDYENLSYDNVYLKSIINKLIEYQMYEEAIPYIDKGLENFPYSFTLMELKGDVLRQTNKTKEAIKYYELSLKHNSADNSLRKTIKDLKNQPNVLNDLIIANAYDFIKENRGKITTNNYGFNILLDDQNIEIFDEGGCQARYVFLYEITSNNGIETFKEYDLGLSGSYSILKSEIVKTDNRVVPAERRGSNLVFNDIAVGDVVYIDYEASQSTTGRFYKDFSDKFQFDSYHPVVESSLQIVIPEAKKLHYKTVNGEIDFNLKNKNGYNIYTWKLSDTVGIKQAENYMPNDMDITRFLHISTLDSWNDISKWYSDLVRSRIEINSTVNDVFNKLFPNGYKQLSETDRAEIIYNYFRQTFTYSYVSFKQSGFVPQKPSKTIKTGLGDCKDFSTLFVTLAKMAEVESNLVLVLTSDYGKKNMILPNTEFNHCIVKANLDGKEHFIELTDKYLPFKSLPMSLREATALEIPYNFDLEKKVFDIFHLDDVLRDKSKLKNELKLIIKEENTDVTINSEILGHNVSYYVEVFSEPNAEVVKTNITDDFKSRLSEDFKLNELKNIERLDNDQKIKFTTNITLNKKLNKIGSTSIFQLPIITHPYESSIIELDTRNYPIEYKQYELVDEYVTDYELVIEDGKKFTEIPESKTFNFKKHSYSINYQLLADNKLKVSIAASPSLERIASEDYQEFKVYVKSIVDAQKEFIAFK